MGCYVKNCIMCVKSITEILFKKEMLDRHFTNYLDVSRLR